MKTSIFYLIVVLLSLSACSGKSSSETEEKAPDALKGLCPDGNHPHMIDLGLPSGTKWACCNVGASTPFEEGDNYAWGEVLPKSEYTESNYLYRGKDIGNDIRASQYDVAFVKWGEEWILPSAEQIKELATKCAFRFVKDGAAPGAYLTGPNGHSLFFYAKGDYIDKFYSEIYLSGEKCSLSEGTIASLFITDDNNTDDYDGIFYEFCNPVCGGYLVRPIHVSSAELKDIQEKQRYENASHQSSSSSDKSSGGYVEVTCPTCNGSGICRECNGSGALHCSGCDYEGSGKCWQCHGLGYIGHTY